MLQGLEALTPWSCCFTVTDFDDALIEINAVLRGLVPSKEQPAQPLDTQHKKLKLEQVYALACRCLSESKSTKPDKQLSFLLADILGQYGRLCYDENYFGAKQALLVSLNFHLYSIGLLSECIDLQDYTSLEDLKKQAESKPNLFAFMEHIAATTNPERCISEAYTKSFLQSYPARRLISLAETARWLGHSYQNIDNYKTVKPAIEKLFENLFGISEGLLLLANNDESKHELASLYYEAWPFMYQRKYPDDTAGICALYDKALAYDSSKEMQARVANKHFLALFAAEKKNEAVVQLKKAIALAEKLEDNDANQFLLANLYQNYARYMISPENLDLEQAEIHLNRAALYAAQRRAKGDDHLYFALYDLCMAEFKVVIGEFSQAKRAAEQALETLRKQPYSQQPHIFKAEAMLSLITKLQALSRRVIS